MKIIDLIRPIDRRRFLQSSSLASLFASAGMIELAASEPSTEFKLRYILGSSLYGFQSLADIIPEISQTGASAIDIWPLIHGNQREQIDEMGEAAFSELIKKHNVELGCITQYKLGPFGLETELRTAKRLGCKTIVTGAEGPVNLKGDELKKAIRFFIERMKPHLAIAEACGVVITIENHANNLIESPDSLRYLAELNPSTHLGIAFAPYHLPQDEELLAQLLDDILPLVHVFYAWQHGDGCMHPMPKEKELLQMPGRGDLDFTSMLKVLKRSNYQGWTEIFMHPFPRGIPILETTSAVTEEINLARSYLDEIVSNI